MKKAILLAVVIAIVSVGLGNSSAEAFGPPEGMRPCMNACDGPMPDLGRPTGMMPKESPVWRHIMGLGLNGEQISEIRDIRDRTKKETITKRADIQVARIELRELLSAEPVDMKKVEAKLKTIEGLRTEVRLLHFKALEEVKTKLTPEQRTKLKELMEMRPMMRTGRMRGMRTGEMGMLRCR